MKKEQYDLNHLEIQELHYQCPLSYEENLGEISVFARQVKLKSNRNRKQPYLLFLQGGPGFPSPDPTNLGSFFTEAIKDYTLVLLDQRGTGLSTPITHQSLAKFETTDEAENYLIHFRADNIIRDAEFIRRSIIANDKWSIVGQSFGGFCCTTYLSMAPESLNEVFITAGLPPTEQHVDNVYRATYQRTLNENKQYFKQFPKDQELAQNIAKHLATNEVLLPNGDRLSVRMFQTLGAMFGGSGGFEQLHYLLQKAFLPGLEDELSYAFLSDVQANNPFISNPIYALLHEAIYAENYASNWSAHRIREEFEQFEYEEDKELLFTGEMVYPWFFEEMSLLKPFKSLADRIAAKTDWPELYNREQLNGNSVPTAAVAYYSDMFVELKFSEELAEQIKDIKLWITNEYKHNGLRADGAKIYRRLKALINEDLPTYL